MILVGSEAVAPESVQHGRQFRRTAIERTQFDAIAEFGPRRLAGRGFEHPATGSEGVFAPHNFDAGMVQTESEGIKAVVGRG